MTDKLEEIDRRLRKIEAQLSSTVTNCIFNEGKINVHKHKDCIAVSYENEIKRDSYVAYSRDADGRVILCRGVHVVELYTVNNYPIIGAVYGRPVPHKFPTYESDSDTIEKRLEGDYFRVAPVKIIGGFDEGQIGDYVNICPRGWKSYD